MEALFGDDRRFTPKPAPAPAQQPPAAPATTATHDVSLSESEPPTSLSPTSPKPDNAPHAVAAASGTAERAESDAQAAHADKAEGSAFSGSDDRQIGYHPPARTTRATNTKP